MKKLLKSILLSGISILFFKCSEQKVETHPIKEMTISDTTEGWGGDVKLSIVKSFQIGNRRKLIVASTSKNKIIGFSVSIPDKNGNGGFGKEAIIFTSLNDTSDNFIGQLADIYKQLMKPAKFKKTISANYVDLDEMAKQLSGGSTDIKSSEKKYKLFFENEKDNAEIFLNTNLEEGWVELREKDEAYRAAIINFLGEK